MAGGRQRGWADYPVGTPTGRGPTFAWAAKRMRFTIDRIDDGLPYEDFRRGYVAEDQPCVIRSPTNAREVSLHVQPAGAFHAWLPSDPEFKRLQPLLLRDYLRRENLSLRQHWGRVFEGVAGQVTPFHFDGNFLDIFNRQLTGQKLWTVVDPATPLPLVPGTNLARQRGTPDLSGVRHSQFMLHVGEVLYLPRLWLHRVVTPSPTAASVSWVMTRLDPPRHETPVLERSVRYTDLFLRLRCLFPRLKMPNACLFNSVHSQENEAVVKLFARRFSLPRSMAFGAAESFRWIACKARRRWARGPGQEKPGSRS